MEMWGKYLAGSGMEHCSKMQIKSVWWREVQMVPVCWQSMQEESEEAFRVMRDRNTFSTKVMFVME